MTRDFTHDWSSSYCGEHKDEDEGYPLDLTVSAKYVEARRVVCDEAIFW